MSDARYVLGAIGFFLVAWAYVRGCAR